MVAVNETGAAGGALEALVPRLMSEFSDVAWRFEDVSEGFRIVLSLTRAPDRVARVRVHGGEEVFVLTLDDYIGVRFEYDSEDKPEALRERIAAGVSAIRGPSRLVLSYAGDVCTRSELVLNVGSADEHRDGVWSERLTKQLGWRLRGRPLRRVTREFDRI